MPLHVLSTTCSSSGGQNCIVQHLVSSQSVGGRPVYGLREDWLECMHYNRSSLNPCTGPTECDDTRCSIIQF